MTDRELMRQELDALENGDVPTPENVGKNLDAITTLRSRLAQPEQEPVGRLESDPYEGHVFVPRIDGDWSMLGEDLYTAPPQRKPWVGLTDEEKAEIWSNNETAMVVTATEKKLKEKNT